jgi:hypothetical protein
MQKISFNYLTFEDQDQTLLITVERIIQLFDITW